MRRTGDRWLCGDGQLQCRILLIQELLRCLILHYTSHILQRQQDPGHKEANMGKNQSTLSSKHVSGSTCLRQRCYFFACIKINSLVRSTGFSLWWNPGEPMCCRLWESPAPRWCLQCLHWSQGLRSLSPHCPLCSSSLCFSKQSQAAVRATSTEPPTCPAPEYLKCCIRSIVGLFLRRQGFAFAGFLLQ